MTEGVHSSTAAPSPTTAAGVSSVAILTAESTASGRRGCITFNTSKKEAGASMGGRKLDASAPAFSPAYAVVQHSTSMPSPQVLVVAAALDSRLNLKRHVLQPAKEKKRGGAISTSCFQIFSEIQRFKIRYQVYSRAVRLH